MSNPVQSEVLQQLVAAVLMGTSSVTAIVENRVVGGFVRDSDWGSLRKPALAIVVDGGEVHYTGVLGSFPMEVWALSADSEGEARRLYDLAFAALQAGDLYVAGIDHRGVAWEQQRPTLGWYDAGSAWYCRGRWLIQASRSNP